MGNRNLYVSKMERFNEFFTLMEDIEKELKYYSFSGKTVYCNCDSEESNFWKYFVKNFDYLGLNKVVCTHYEKDKRSYKLEYDGKNCIKTYLCENGDFRSEECVSLLHECDILVSNPPFSLFQTYIKTIITNSVDFLVIGNINNIITKDIFPYIMEKKMFLGVNSGAMNFRVPDDCEKETIFIKNEKKYVRFGNVCWCTNLDNPARHRTLNLKHLYDDSYSKLDSYDALYIKKVTQIPADYPGVMAVPVTFLEKHNPEQFEIIGKFTHEAVGGYNLANPCIDKKVVYPRIAIRNLSV